MPRRARPQAKVPPPMPLPTITTSAESVCMPTSNRETLAT